MTVASLAPRRSSYWWALTAIALGLAAGAVAVALDTKVFAVAAAGGVFLLSLVYVWRDPKLGLYLAVITFSLDALGRLPLTDAFPVTLYQVAIVVVVLSALNARRTGQLALSWKRTPVDLPLLLFVSLAFASVWFAPSLRTALVMFGSLVSAVVLFYLITMMVDTPEEARRLLLWFLTIAAVLAVVAITERVTGISIAGNVSKSQVTGIRVRGSFKDPNMFGMMMMMALVMGTALIKGESSRMRVGLAAGGAVVLAALALSFSRGAWVAAIVAVIAVVLAYPGDRAKRVVPLVVTLVLAGSIAMAALPDMFVQKKVLQVTQDKSAMARVYMAEAGTNIVQQNPLGVGIGGFPSIFPSFRVGTVKPSLIRSHIAYLTILVELGIPGLLLFLWILWRFAISAWPDIRKGRKGLAARVQLAACGAALGILVQALTYSVELSKQLWFSLGILMAAHLLLSRGEEADG